MPEEKRRLSDWLVNLAARSLLGLAGLLPYRMRIPFMGWLSAHLVAPLAGYRGRIRANLALTCPELPRAEVERLVRAVGNNAGRMLGEMYSADELRARVAQIPLTGPGVAALEQARLARRPIVAVSGHFGSYDVLRIAFDLAGHSVGGLYRPMSNGYFNAHYTRAMHKISQPTFKQGRRGLAGMLKHLRAGNMIALLTDQRDEDGARLRFFGHPVMTPLSAAELALKYDAILIPAYGIRQPDGLGFDIVIEEPIAHSDPESMMQAVNDSLEARVRAHMDQWLWIHRRWKMPDGAS